MHSQGDHWPRFHGEVPQLEAHVVPAEDVPAVPAEADVTDGGDDLREE